MQKDVYHVISCLILYVWVHGDVPLIIASAVLRPKSLGTTDYNFQVNASMNFVQMR